MKVLIVPDSYKGSLSASKVADTIKIAIEENSDSVANTMPLSDGGEGFADAFESLCNGKRINTKCQNIYGQEIDGYIVAFDDLAVVECATASGLLSRKNVMQASSIGTGELIKFAYDNGYKRIILGLGGTGCCDGGAGALAGLGGKFYDENWNIISRPKGNDLNFIFGVDLKECPKDLQIVFASDVENEYFGKNGAAYVFAPQKGARRTDVEELDEGLKRLNAFFKNDISKVKGAGAAGGICGALYSLYGGEIKSGFDILAEYSKLEEKIQDADIIITGEGKTDSQTLMGKLPFKVAQLAKKHGKRCVVISGIIEDISLGDVAISLVDDTTTVDEAMADTENVLYKKVKNNLEIILK